MKKFTLKVVSLVLAVCLLSSQTFALSGKTQAQTPKAVDESVFSFDEELFNAEMEELNALDEYIEANEGVTFNDLVNEGSILVANIDNSASPMGMDDENNGPPLGIPSFLWGCVFGLIGLLIVYVATDNDKAEARKAMWGCLLGSLISGAIYVVWFAALESTY